MKDETQEETQVGIGSFLVLVLVDLAYFNLILYSDILSAKSPAPVLIAFVVAVVLMFLTYKGAEKIINQGESNDRS